MADLRTHQRLPGSNFHSKDGSPNSAIDQSRRSAGHNDAMSLVYLPLAHGKPTGAGFAATTVRTMEIGQNVIAVLLTVVAVIRAIGSGVAWPFAVIAGVAVLTWHTAGALLPATTNSRTLAVWWLVGFTAIWIAAVAVSPEFVWLAFLIWLLAGHLLPLFWGLAFSSFVLAIVIAAPVLHHGATTYANIFGPLIGGVFAFGISRGYLQLLQDLSEREALVTSLTVAQEQMAQLQDELALAQRHSGTLAERTRISRDIHDTIAQALSSIRLLAHAGANLTEDEVASNTFERVGALAGESLADVRRIVAALAPSELEDSPLAAALQRMLERLETEANLQTEMHLGDDLPTLSTEFEVALLRTAQSALANVRFHAGATRVVMSLIDADDSIRLDIADDGAGFDIQAWEAAPPATSSFGLRFMRSRLRELGGGLDIESTPGEGTTLSAHLPIQTIATHPAPMNPKDTR